MSNLLLLHFRSRIPISDHEFNLLLSYMEHFQVKKKHKILCFGEVCNTTFYVNQGLLYSYSTDSNGLENVVNFAMEDYWIGDMYSFINKTPSNQTIVALENSDIYQLSNDALEILFDKIPALEKFYRILYQNAYTHTLQRLDCSLNVSAQERYLKIVNENPKLLQRAPLHLIASYLGITPESLSRIRKKIYL
ncbi:Crp/Fnr family transcriptional regulator [Apibacter muscae]|uniref:Crp/Fnr family transcriptional regulator n=1 Tax=Apibacter muscae TaxID=2509004 RepID=UPI0011AD76B4|nr:Crp/Fnr family transcriptional regulator [Apibacter muscae]TWP24378.1 Crp/Fnr family transcriptional regulator [Apibacter muscae]